MVGRIWEINVPFISELVWSDFLQKDLVTHHLYFFPLLVLDECISKKTKTRTKKNKKKKKKKKKKTIKTTTISVLSSWWQAPERFS